MVTFQGGSNNFGIVTKFTLLAFPQDKVWGGLQTFTANQIPEVSAATIDFINEVTDRKAGIITTYNFLLGQASQLYALCTIVFEVHRAYLRGRTIAWNLSAVIL